MRTTILLRVFICAVLLTVCSKSYSQGIASKWAGTYYAEAKNKDHLKTSFYLSITATGNISLKYRADGEAENVYKNLKAVTENPDKLKIVFNPKTGDMGVLYLEREDDDYYFSGQPVYFINPGSEQLLAKKSPGNNFS